MSIYTTQKISIFIFKLSIKLLRIMFHTKAHDHGETSLNNKRNRINIVAIIRLVHLLHPLFEK